MKKVVIVGGTALLAQYLKPRLLKYYEVVSFGRKNCDIQCDLLDSLDSIVFPDNIDIVVHVAASSNGNNDEEILLTEEVNALGTLKVCIAAHKAKVKHLIIVSSIYATLGENASYYNIYSISKKHSEELAVYFCKSKKLPLTILRPSQLYDEKGEYRKHQPLLYLMADRAEAGEDIIIYGSNDAMRNYIHVEDLVEIIIRIIKTGCLGAYSCTNPQNVKLSEIARAAFSSFNKGGKIIFLKDKKDIPDNVFPIDSLLYEKIGFYPQIGINSGMDKISNYRKRNNL